MCGIAGIFSNYRKGEKLLPAVRMMADALAHRGPDDAGVEIVSKGEYSAHVVLGHRRLSIIDLSSAGHQPMHDPESDCWITYNGELYNFKDIRNELQRKGWVFFSNTDTEVILKAYAEWGEKSVARFRGIFAFGIWDNRKKQLFLARDQMGVKPLYIFSKGGTSIFSSEVRGILASGLVERQIDLIGLFSFLSYGSVQEPYTMINGIRSIPPGTYYIIDDMRIIEKRYWKIENNISSNDLKKEDVLINVKERLHEVMELQLVSDVSIGAFLSGGIDSTAIASVMQRVSGGKVNTFSIIFDETQYDERRYSRYAASHIGSNHTELLLSGKEILQMLPAALKCFDQPSVDGINTFFVSKVTREAGITVALSGVGGDELFAGYNAFRRQIKLENYRKFIRKLPPAFLSGFAKIIHRNGLSTKYSRYSDLFDIDRHSYFMMRRLFSFRQLYDIIRLDWKNSIMDWDPDRFEYLENESNSMDDINRSSFFELNMYMLSTLLRDTDQMSMAHALEVRVPLIDHKLVEYLFSIPGNLKVDKIYPKPLLTQALNGYIPEYCIFRKKRGFELPFNKWLKNELKDQVGKTILSSDVDLFNREELEKLWNLFLRGKMSWSRIWGLYILIKWIAINNVKLH